MSTFQVARGVLFLCPFLLGSWLTTTPVSAEEIKSLVDPEETTLSKSATPSPNVETEADSKLLPFAAQPSQSAAGLGGTSSIETFGPGPITSASLDLSQTSKTTTELAPIEQSQPQAQFSPSVPGLLKDVEFDSIGQVTDVTQLSDVEPTDWAFQALQSLVERYGCIAGYPDGTFKGNSKATRYELAAALNACLDQISDRFATKEDLAAVKALQEEFAAELAVLKGRVDGLEARVDTIEAQQFSTTTKLSVKAVFSGQFGDADGPFDISTDGITVGDQLGDSRPSAIGTVYMSFNTSFSGDDLLETTLFFGNGGQDLFTAAQVGSTPSLPFGESTPLFNPGQYYFAGVGTNALLYRLAYTFKPIEDLAITAAPLFYPTDIIDGNSYTSPFTGFSTWFFINNPLITPYITNFLGGAGGGFDWNIDGGPFSVRGAYAAVGAGIASGTNPGITSTVTQGGLFSDPYQATVELEYADNLSENIDFAVRLQYTNSETANIKQNVGGVNAEFNIGRFGIFGRYGYSDADAGGNVNPIPFAPGVVGDFVAQTFQAGVGVKDLLVPGSLLAAAVGQPFINNLPESPGINDDTQWNVEAFYRFPVNDFITISPIFSAILNPNNSSREANLYQGLVRVVFSF